MVDLSKDEWPEDGPELARQQSWPADGTAELELSVDVGRIRVQLDEQVGDGGAQEVRVEVRHDPSAGGTWSQGQSGLLN